MRFPSKLFVGLLALVLVLSACSMQVQAPQPGVATFTATEYAYAGPDSIPAGMTELVIENTGEQPHSLWLVKLEDGKTVEDLKAIYEGEVVPEWLERQDGISGECAGCRSC